MKITIDTDVLARYNLNIGQFIVMLMAYFDTDYHANMEELSYKKLIDIDHFKRNSMVLSDNSKNLVAKIITECDPRLKESPVRDFEDLAFKLQSIYPTGMKEGTTYWWRGTIAEIAQKLRVLVTVHGFIYTEKEAVNATKAYVYSFQEKGDYTHMKLLKYFLLRTKGNEISSDFMSIIENNREEVKVNYHSTDWPKWVQKTYGNKK